MTAMQGVDPWFVPLNEMEKALVEARTGRMGLQEFVPLLLRLDLVIGSQTQINPDGTGLRPLTLNKDGHNFLGVFTARERTRRYEGVKFCMDMPGREVLRMLPPGYGVVVNPGLFFSIEIPEEGVRGLLQEFGGGAAETQTPPPGVPPVV